LREKNRLEGDVGAVRRVETELRDTLELIALGEAEGEAEIVREAETALSILEKEADKMRLQSLLSGEADGNDAYLEVNSGAGGTEAADWAGILLRMYTRWADRHGFKVEILDRSEGEEAGIKSATVQISGHQAYGWLKSEGGVHRLVRISPFDSNARRHTSFASVSVSPVIDDTIEIEILDKDLKIDTYRASGAGGQHVNRTDSAVRITHIPTGIVCACQNDRSQHKNRASAMAMVKAKLYEMELKKREESSNSQYDNKSDIGWGHQIRSYVLQPYQMIKDLRTGVERTDAQVVLDGDIDPYLHAALAQKITGGAESAKDEGR
jgi:peptide chain release factor 2